MNRLNRRRNSLRIANKQSIKLKHIVLVASLGIIVPAVIFTCINVFKYDYALGAVNGDYRSKTDES